MFNSEIEDLLEELKEILDSDSSHNDSNLTGRDVAEKMLRDNNINDVSIVSISGEMTDFYNPAKKIVALSVYQDSNIKAYSIAAHECAHAIQHRNKFSFLNFRLKLIPIVNFTLKYYSFAVFIGMILLSFTKFYFLFFIAILFLVVNALFNFITLLVEYNASKIALQYLQQNSIIQSALQYKKGKRVLKNAFLTYFYNFLGSFVMLIFYIILFLILKK